MQKQPTGALEPLVNDDLNFEDGKIIRVVRYPDGATRGCRRIESPLSRRLDSRRKKKSEGPTTETCCACQYRLKPWLAECSLSAFCEIRRGTREEAKKGRSQARKKGMRGSKSIRR